MEEIFMLFDLGINIVLSFVILVFIAGFYLMLSRFLSNENRHINKWLIFILYIIYFIFVVGAIGFGLYMWGLDVETYLTDLWDDIGDAVLDKVGAIIMTVLIIVVMGFITKLFKYFVKRSQKLMITSNDKRRHTILKVTSSIVNYTVKILALILILAAWGVNVLPALAGLGILGLVIGLGAQDLIKDIIAGFFIVFERHFDVGDMIEVNGFKGEVIDIGLKTTRVRNWKQDVKIFNNSSLQNTINYSVTQSLAIVDFGIEYEADVDKTLEVLAAELPKLRPLIPELTDDPVCVGVTSLADSSVNLRVIGKTNTEQHYGVERMLRKEIKKILDANDIGIPFPQVVVHQAKD
jgi:small conductance mechanosensitive channel